MSEEKKICPIMTRFAGHKQYGGADYESNEKRFEGLECIKEKCMAWGVINTWYTKNDSGKMVVNRTEGCKLIERPK